MENTCAIKLHVCHMAACYSVGDVSVASRNKKQKAYIYMLVITKKHIKKHIVILNIYT